MKNKLFILKLLIVFVVAFAQGCFPTYKASLVSSDTLASGEYHYIQAKVFTKSNNIFLFPNGFRSDENSIVGQGMVKALSSEEMILKKIELDKDSIAALITYEESTSGTRYFGSFLYGLTSPFLTFSGIYCIACPKCCFGSCPTIYTFDGTNYNLEAELFSECISRQLEKNDIDLLKQQIKDDKLLIKITNEALETHYINKFNIIIAEHNMNTELYPTITDNIILFSEKLPAIYAENKMGEDISSLIKEENDDYYRSGVEKIAQLKNGYTTDYIDIFVPVSKDGYSKIVIKYRNTLLSTMLLYDVVIGSQGMAALEWTYKMNNNAVYAKNFKMVYDAFSGITIKSLKNNNWLKIGKFKDAGPLAWKYLAAELILVPDETNIIRLENIPDNFMIDFIAFDTTSTENNNFTTRKIYPQKVNDGFGNEANEILKYLVRNDKDYLKTEPGDVYNLEYSLTNKKNLKQTALIFSKGYYNEWIRGNWIVNSCDTPFNLYDVDGTLNHLANSWLTNSSLLENEFFNSRIILREEK